MSAVLLAVCGFVPVARAQNVPSPLPYNGGTVTQNFDTLATAAATTNTTLPPGFGFVESGTGANLSYGASTGSDGQGDTYSYGAAGGGERALGGLQSGSVVPTFGVFIRNDTGTTLTQFTLSYCGEQYRLGTLRGTAPADRLDFQYSTSATALNGTGFVDADALDFTAPVTTGTVGVVAGKTAISATVTGVSVAPGAVLVLRWSDFNASGADDGLAIDDFSFSTLTVQPTPAPTPNPTPAPTPNPGVTSGALISEFRTSGPGGSADEFIEIYNSSGASLDISGWSVGAGNVTIAVPAGTAALPVRGHLLLTGSAYSLSSYGTAGQASGDVSYSGDIAAGATLTLRNAAGAVADIVSGSGLPTPVAGSQWSLLRRLESSAPQDTGVDSDDFNLVEINSTAAGASSNLGVTAGALRLGAPGPKNRNSPTLRIEKFTDLVNPAQGANVGDNGLRTGSGNSGTLSLRRVIVNRSGATIKRLRLRIAAITSGTPTGPNASTVADVRLLNGVGNFTVNGTDVTALKVETVPDQNSGGALNSTLLVTLPAGGLAPDAKIGVEVLLSIVKSGSFRVLFFIEAANDDLTPSRPDDDNLLLGNPSAATVLNAQASNKENLLVERAAISLGYQKSQGTPRWVSWHLDSGDIGSSGRSGSFKPDPLLPADCRITDADYSNSGFTRGHQCPSGDRTASDALNQEVFLMSNMVPQTAQLNNGVWNDFEVFCRNQLSGGANELYIMTGGVGSNGSIAGGKVNVPASCWKVAVILPKGSDDLKRISTATRVLAVLIPNTNTVSGPYTKFLTSVDNIENLTGLDLLSNLPDGVENNLEARVGN